jgi:hypothetical protein
LSIRSMTMLLGGEQARFTRRRKKKDEPKKPIALPAAHSDKPRAMLIRLKHG